MGLQYRWLRHGFAAIALALLVSAGAVVAEDAATQSVAFEIVIPELPPLALGGEAFAMAGGRILRQAGLGAESTAIMMDRHGRVFQRQVIVEGGGSFRMLAAP